MCKSDRSRRIVRTLLSIGLIIITLAVGYFAADAVGLFPFERKNELFPKTYLLLAAAIMAAVLLAGIFFLYLQEPVGPLGRRSYRPFLTVAAFLAVACYLVLSLGMRCNARRDIAGLKTTTPSILTTRVNGTKIRRCYSVLYAYTDGKLVHADTSANRIVSTLTLTVPLDECSSEQFPVLSQEEEAFFLHQEHYIVDAASQDLVLFIFDPAYMMRLGYDVGEADMADKIVCVFGPDWKASTDVYCVPGQSGAVYWVPAETYVQCMEAGQRGELYAELPPYDPVDPDTGRQIVPPILLENGRSSLQYVWCQTLFLLALYALGALIVYSFGGRNVRPLLRALLAFPAGCAVMILYCVLLSFLNIRIGYCSLGIGYAVWLAVPILRALLKKLPAGGLVPSAVFLPVFAMICIYFAYSQNYYASPDSALSMFLGQRLIRFGGFAGQIGSYVAYGSFSVMLSAMGEALNIGVPYAVYPMMFVQAVLLTGAYCFLNNRHEGKKKVLIAAALAVLTAALLLTCKEYEYHKFWILNNLPVSVYMLIFTQSLLSMGNENPDSRLHILLCLLCGGLVMTTRTEGALYLAFLFALSLVGEARQSGRIRVIIGLTAICLLYNAGIWLYARGSGNAFWSEGKAALSVAALTGMLFISLLYGCLQKKKPAVSKYAGLLFALAVIAMLGASLVLDPYGLAAPNAITILKSMSENTLLPMCAFLAVLFVLNLGNIRRKDNQTAVLAVFGYCALVFCMFLFRVQNGAPVPLHAGYSDSGRRTLFQAIPLFLSLLSSNITDTVLGLKSDSPPPLCEK